MDAASVPGLRGRVIPRSRTLLRALDDERLVERLRGGEDAAFEILYDRHHRGMLSLCRHMLGSREEAEDALQQAFASAYRELAHGDRQLQVRAWLYTIARNRCLTTLRARREQPAAEVEPVSTAGLAEEVERRAELRALVADLQELPEEQRAALVLAEIGDLTHADIAAILGCEVSKVKSLVFQARSGLIERRDARDAPCEEIREQLSVLTGGSLRRGPIRRHLKECPGCREFREEVRRQRVMLAVVLPAIPSIGVKEGALAALGLGGGVVAAVGGGASVGAQGGGSLAGAIGAALGKAGAAKLAAVAVAGTAAAGGVAVVASDPGSPAQPVPASPAVAAPAAPLAPGPGAGAPALGEAERDERSARRRAAVRERRRSAAAQRRRERGGRATGRSGSSADSGAPRPGRSGNGRRSTAGGKQRAGAGGGKQATGEREQPDGEGDQAPRRDGGGPQPRDAPAAGPGDGNGTGRGPR